MRKFLLGLLAIVLILSSSPAFAAYGGCAFGDCGTGSGSGASVSDAVYGSGWNGDTTNAPSKNSVYDKIEALSVGAGAGATTYLSCSDDIQTKVTAATAGDTLILGSCTYTIATTITVNKALTILGQGPFSTLIDSGTTNIGTQISTNADGLKIRNLGLRGTRVATGISADATGGTSFTGANILFENLDITLSNTVTAVTNGIAISDGGARYKNITMFLNSHDLGGSAQSRGIREDFETSCDVPTYTYVDNVHIEVSSDSGVAGENGSLMRTIRFYNDHNGDCGQNNYIYINGLYAKVRDYSTTPYNNVEAIHFQGAGVVAYIQNSSLDGYGTDTNGYVNGRTDFRCDDGATCYFANTSLVGGFRKVNLGTAVRQGILYSAGLQMDAGNTPFNAPNGIDVGNFFSGTGAVGGNATGTGARAGGNGGGVSLIGGAGGPATAATTTGTGGQGGGFSLLGGDGAAQTTATSTTNVGGAGADLVIKAGTGGAANSAGTTNTGGRGGRVYISTGNVGIGSTANGAAGVIAMAIDSSNNRYGNVSIGTTTNSALLHIKGSATGGTGYAVKLTDSSDSMLLSIKNDGNVGIGTVTPTTLFQVFDTGSGFNQRYINNSASSSSLAVGMAAINDDGAAMAANDQLPYVCVGGARDASHSLSSTACITAVTTQTWTAGATGTDMQFITVPNSSTTRTIRMTLNQAGNLGIGTTLPASKFVVFSGTAQTIAGGNVITADHCGSIKRISSAGAVTTDTTNTFTAPATGQEGCVMTVCNVGANNITLDNNSNFKSAGGADVVMTPDDCLIVGSTGAGGAWYQITALEAN